MWDFLRGTIHQNELVRVTLAVGGQGFDVTVPTSTGSAIGGPGTEATLWIHYHQRDEGPALFGFASLPERIAFKLAIGVESVGPRLGVTLLSKLSVREFAEAIRDKDVPALCRVKGIGKRRAERLVLELADKVGVLLEAPAPARLPVAGAADDDGERALLALGYSAVEAGRAIARARVRVGPRADLEALVRAALREA